MINTLRMSKRFIEAGVSKKQAEVFAEAFKEIEDEHLKGVSTKEDIKSLATKVDVMEVKGDITKLEGELIVVKGMIRSIDSKFNLLLVLISVLFAIAKWG